MSSLRFSVSGSSPWSTRPKISLDCSRSFSSLVMSCIASSSRRSRSRASLRSTPPGVFHGPIHCYEVPHVLLLQPVREVPSH